MYVYSTSLGAGNTCSDPKKLDTKVPVLILARVLAVEPANLPRIGQG
jgi:hypothetical protein